MEALFHAALALSPEDQSAFVSREATDDPALARELRDMLAHAATAASRIERAVGAVAGAIDAANPWLGRLFGPYRLVREIGRGGMGLVFEAVRADDEYRKTVALKIAPGWYSPEQLRDRFRTERQILAELEHPNIARFLDGGTADGIPYFVMEYVEGVPLTTYCSGQQIDLRGRLALFRQICGAVHFAHESLVVHRDLKPANIVVADDGTPKLLDFGVATLLDPLTDTSTTAGGPSMWTPDYASPEQVRGRAVTPRVDVYALGLILYELITGERAQVVDASTPLALDRSICDDQPPPPSTRADTRGDRLQAWRLRGDLDTIVLTAIHKDPDRRYRTVAALNDDIGRYLEGRPILARRASAAYRVQKFLVRHRHAALASTLVALTLAGGVAATIHQARRAERRFQQVRALANAFVFDVHDRIERLPGSTGARKAIVETALRYLENLRLEVADDAALSRELAAAYERIGIVQGHPLRANLGDTHGALASFARATELLEPIASRGDWDARRQLASVAHHVAVVRRAQGDRRAALDGFVRAAEMGSALIRSRPSDRAALSLMGEIEVNRSRAAFELRELAVAKEAAERAMDVARQLATLDPRNPDVQTNLASAHNALGTTHMALGALEQAAREFRAGIEVRERLVRLHPENIDYRRNLAVSYGYLGDLLGYRPGENLGDTTGAALAFRKAVELVEWARVRDPEDRRAPFDLANAHIRLGALLLDADPSEPSGALKEFEAADRITAELLQQDATVDRYRYLMLVIDRRMADALAAQQRTDEAIRRYERVRVSAPALIDGPNGPNARSQLVLATIGLAGAYVERGSQRTLALAENAAQELERQPLPSPLLTATAHHQLGRIYVTHARNSELATEARDLRRRALSHLQVGARLWREARLVPALEPRRTKVLATLASEMAPLNGERRGGGRRQ